MGGTYDPLNLGLEVRDRSGGMKCERNSMQERTFCGAGERRLLGAEHDP